MDRAVRALLLAPALLFGRACGIAAAGAAGAVVLLSRGAALAQTPDVAAIQRELLSLRLGDHLKQVRMLFPPTRDWPSYVEPGTHLKRIQIRRSYAKFFPDDVETFWLGLRWGRVVYIQAIFDADGTAKEPLEKTVVDLSTMYGEPHRFGTKYFWRDGSTVLRASEAEVPAADGRGVELRKSLELMNDGEYRP